MPVPRAWLCTRRTTGGALARRGRGSLGHQPPLAQGSGAVGLLAQPDPAPASNRPCNNRNGSSHPLWSSEGWPGPSAKRTTRIISLIVAATAEDIQPCSPGEARRGGCGSEVTQPEGVSERGSWASHRRWPASSPSAQPLGFAAFYWELSGRWAGFRASSSALFTGLLDVEAGRHWERGRREGTTPLSSCTPSLPAPAPCQLWALPKALSFAAVSCLTPHSLLHELIHSHGLDFASARLLALSLGP